MTTATTRRKRDWAAHDAAIPFRDPVMFKLNGTNPMGRRPHSLVEPQRLKAANDNRARDGERVALGAAAIGTPTRLSSLTSAT